MRYRIVYRDGYVSGPYAWTQALSMVHRAQRYPPPLQALRVEHAE